MTQVAQRRTPVKPAGLFKAVATDLDGTLLRSDLTVSARSRRALALASASGVRHVVVTGRQASNCRSLLKAIGYRGIAVCGQGGQIYDVDADRLIWTRHIDVQIGKSIVAHVRSEFGDVSVGVATAGVNGRMLVNQSFYSNPGKDCRVVDEATLWAQPIERVFFRYRPVEAATLLAEIETLLGTSVTLTYGQAGVVEVLPAGVTKGVGLEYVAGLQGFTRAETIAFGDMPNDLPMFEWAGYSVAMANADECLHARADEICLSNDKDGVAAVLERLCASEPQVGAAEV